MTERLGEYGEGFGTVEKESIMPLLVSTPLFPHQIRRKGFGFVLFVYFVSRVKRATGTSERTTGSWLGKPMAIVLSPKPTVRCVGIPTCRSS